MSFSKYLESKFKSNINILIDVYKENLQADLSSLLIKPNNQQLIEAYKNIVNIKYISNILSELNYPFITELQMAVRTGIPKKASQARIKFQEWAKNKDKNLVNQVSLILYQYEETLFNKTFEPKQIDEIVKSCVTESMSILEEIGCKINLSISSLKKWGNYPINIEAIIPNKNEGLIVSEAKITIGDAFKAEFQISEKFKINNVKNENLPHNMKFEIQNLLDNLNKNNSKLLTLYATIPISNRKYFENLKRDLALGIKSVLPNYIILKNIIEKTENNDIWKIKIDGKYLKEYFNENYKEYHLLGEEILPRSIERI